jgi:Cft2 family RNA processing exonuclease
MESNFNRIRKSMQRDLPLISIKFHLRLQLKKLNSYMKVLLKRKKKRFFLRSERKKNFKSNLISKSTQFYDNQSKKEKDFLSIKLFNFSKKRFVVEKKDLIDYVKKFIEHLFFIIFRSNNLRVFYIKKYQMNVMGTKAKLFKNLFNYRLATGFKIPFLVKVICKKLNFDKSLVGCKIGFFGRYSKKLRNRKI